jgi:hypothetical protein
MKKECEFRTWQSNKCVNEKNKECRKVNSCTDALCPLPEEKEKEELRQSVQPRRNDNQRR